MARWVVWVWDCDLEDWDMWDEYETREAMLDALHSLRSDGVRCYGERA